MWLKPYNHLVGYLHRWSVLSIGRLRVRIHHILDVDRTPFLHTHPFHYVSIILSGGYTDQVLVNGVLVERAHRVGSVIVRSDADPHRITSLLPNTKTLFITWVTSLDQQGWSVSRHPDVGVPEGYFDPPDGIYQHGTSFRKRQNGVWFALRQSIADAQSCDRLSIHQDIPPEALTHALDPTKQLVQRGRVPSTA